MTPTLRRQLHSAATLQLLEPQFRSRLVPVAVLQPAQDCAQLWRRIVFNILISNTDDHLRNHGFLLHPSGWRLAPAYDMNPIATADGLCLNISETDNALSLELAEEVSSHFRVKPNRAKKIIEEVAAQVRGWRKIAKSLRMPTRETDRMANAFRMAENA